MTEDPGRLVIPPKPPLPPKKLRAALRRADRGRARAEHHERTRARRAQKRARRADTSIYHGHTVVSRDVLAATFPDEERIDNPVLFRHRLVHGITLTVLAAVLIAAVVLAVMLWKGYWTLPEARSAPSPTVSCPSSSFDYPANATVHVNVYNATQREGLATSVAAELKKRGYLVGTVANKDTNYTGTAVVAAGPAGQSAAFNLQRNIAGTDYVQDDRTDASVDVYLTGAFNALVAADLVDQTPGPLSCPRLSPSPTAPAPSTTAAPAP
jgi:hypothetical protein